MLVQKGGNVLIDCLMQSCPLCADSISTNNAVTLAFLLKHRQGIRFAQLQETEVHGLLVDPVAGVAKRQMFG